MYQTASSPLLENGGFFVARNNRPRAAEAAVSFPQALAAGLSIATFVCGGLLLLAGVA